ncbi:uncharacterized protein LOC142354884, partial [Convolutriloba macropyga]|uniref:uncharacterized protein LOC142354884 n=1 Tax=Convolutriloba macropyga TaxID=536237 RepID=UPI003F5205E1
NAAGSGLGPLGLSPIGSHTGPSGISPIRSGPSTSGYYGSSGARSRGRRPGDVASYSPDDAAMETPERFHLGSSGYGRGNGGPVGRNIFPDDLDMSGIGPSGYEAPNIQLDDEDSDDDHYMYERGAYGGKSSPLSPAYGGDMNRLNVTRGDIDLGIDDQGSTEWSDVIQDRSTDLNPNQIDWFDYVESLKGQTVETPPGALSPER